MWLTVLVLAVAINLEPARPTWVPIMLARPRPMLQLWAFFCGNVVSGLVAGLLVLFVFHQTIGSQDKTSGVRIQIGIGVAIVVVAAILAASGIRKRRLTAPVVAGGEGATDSNARPSPFERFAAPAMAFLGRGSSPWLSAAIGVGTGLPSIDYLAALVVIGSAGAPPAAQIGALVMFLIVGNAVAVVPLLTYLAAPEATLQRIERFRVWVQSRTRQQFAAIIAAVGIIQIVIGLARL